MDTDRVTRVIQSLSDVERGWLNNVLDMTARGPASLRDLWSEAWFGESSERALMIQPAYAGAFFYVPACAWAEHLREIEHTLEVAMLLDLLVTAGFMQIHHALQAPRGDVRCIGAIFSEPRVEVVRGKPRIVINEAGDYTEDPATIVNSAGEVLYRSARLGHDAFDLVHETTQGILLIRPVERVALLAALGAPIRSETTEPSSHGRDALSRADAGGAPKSSDDVGASVVCLGGSDANAQDTRENSAAHDSQEAPRARFEPSGGDRQHVPRGSEPNCQTGLRRRRLLIGAMLTFLCVAVAGLALSERAWIHQEHASGGGTRQTDGGDVPASAPTAAVSAVVRSPVAVDANATNPQADEAAGSEPASVGASGPTASTGASEAGRSAQQIGAFLPERDGKEVAVVDSMPEHPRGLDVSQWSGKGKSGAEAVFAVAPRIDFAFARVAYGTRRDPEFLENWKLMEKRGVYRGAYLFLRVDEDPIKQVDAAVDTIGPATPRDLCLTIDIERMSFPLHVALPDVTTVDRVLSAALQRVEETMKCTPMIYTDWDTGHDYLNAAEFARFPLWIADWTKASSPKLPPAWSDFKFWQRADHFHNSPVPADFDVFNGTAAELGRLVRLASRQPASSLLP
ncbi:GH25 family lysozyme [Paraburkholderia ribeironis]|nr:GH25 family lysozyme [Paraburkholderia ribeironis]